MLTNVFSNIIIYLQLSQCTDRKRQLELKCEDSTNDERFRMLGGCDPKPEDLNKTIQDVSECFDKY